MEITTESDPRVNCSVCGRRAEIEIAPERRPICRPCWQKEGVEKRAEPAENLKDLLAEALIELEGVMITLDIFWNAQGKDDRETAKELHRGSREKFKEIRNRIKKL